MYLMCTGIALKGKRYLFSVTLCLRRGPTYKVRVRMLVYRQCCKVRYSRLIPTLLKGCAVDTGSR